MKKQILLVDDEPAILDVCKRYLEREGYLVVTSANGEEALQLWQEHRFHVIVLDLMMPVLDGWKVCEEIRKTDDVPIVFLTAKGEEYDRLIGLTIGANDYITKPFNPRELVLRINAICRLLEYSQKSKDEVGIEQVLKVSPFTIHSKNREVFWNDRLIDLTMKEYDLLFLLASHPKQVFSRSQLLYKVWQTEFDDDTTTVTVHIRRLREKIEVNPSKPKYIQTVWGIGYKFLPGDLV
ncbi:response regulator transcription factor [Robertmurraya massiliosenegalensis]|uniref:response regulator transcription factor n=1 Tax=Robertmurraya TaxID=2837507 RepID=UPI0039A6B332